MFCIGTMAELSEGEIPSEGSDEGELPDSEPEETEKATENEVKKPEADKFERFKVWQSAMTNNLRSAMAKVGPPGAVGGQSSDESSGSDYEDRMVINKSLTACSKVRAHICLLCFRSNFSLFLGLCYPWCFSTV